MKEEDGTRPALLNEVLDAAERLAQLSDYSNLTLKRIAQELGVHYTAVYHYVPSREALDAELMLRISERRDRLLKAAINTDRARLEALCEYVRQAITQLPPTNIARVLALSQPHRSRVQQALRSHQRTLAELIEHGIRDGSVRPCNAGLAASYLFRILNRFADRHEAGLAQAGLSAAQLAEVVVDIVSHGLLLPGVAMPDLTALKRMLRDPPAAPETRLDSILKALTEEINDLGFTGTSIPAVGRKLGVSKTVLYGYAKSKEELLFLCSERSVARLDKVRTLAGVISDDCLSAIWANVHLERQFATSAEGRFLPPSTYVFLTPEHQRCAAERYWSTRHHIVALLEQGIGEGKIRPHDPRVMQPLAAAGTSATAGRHADRGPEDTDRLVDLIFHGLAPRA